MAQNFGNLNRNIFGDSLYIKGRLVVDNERKMNVRSASINNMTVRNDGKIKGNLDVQGNLIVDGTDLTVNNDAKIKGNLEVEGNLIVDGTNLTCMSKNILYKESYMIPPVLYYDTFLDLGPNKGDGCYVLSGTILDQNMDSPPSYKVFDIFRSWNMISSSFTQTASVTTTLVSNNSYPQYDGASHIDNVVYDGMDNHFKLQWHSDSGAIPQNIVFDLKYLYNSTTPYL